MECCPQRGWGDARNFCCVASSSLATHTCWCAVGKGTHELRRLQPNYSAFSIAWCLQVLWLNNPSRDKEYKHLARDTRMLLNMYPGRLAPMAANLMTLVSITNPISAEGVALAGVMQRLHDRSAELLHAILLSSICSPPPVFRNVHRCVCVCVHAQLTVDFSCLLLVVCCQVVAYPSGCVASRS